MAKQPRLNKHGQPLSVIYVWDLTDRVKKLEALAAKRGVSNFSDFIRQILNKELVDDAGSN